MLQPTNGVTREALQNAEKMSSPAIDAEMRLQEAVAQVGGMETKKAIELLDSTIEAAMRAGVYEKAPPLKRAVALRSTLQMASVNEPNPEADPNKAALDALFGGGYAIPDLDDDEW